MYYFGYDSLGSQVAVLNNSGTVVGSQLYSPYGSQRYSNGTLPTSIGFTGQRADSVTGLDYYNATYYDPVAGRFMAADTAQGNVQGMDPYSYVGGNPESRTDPTGKRWDFGGGEQAWINNGTIYESSPGQPYTVVGTIVSTYVPTPTAKPKDKPKVQDDGHNDSCSMSVSQCNQAEKNRAAQNQALQISMQNLQLGASAANLVFDLMHVAKDFVGGWSFDSITRLVGDAISVIGDVASVFASIASRFSLGWLSPIADMIGAIASGVGAAYRLATASKWGMGVIVATFYTLKAAFIEGDIGLEAENAMFSVEKEMTVFDVIAAIRSFVTGMIQSGIDAYLYRIDSNNNKPLNGFCPC